MPASAIFRFCGRTGDCGALARSTTVTLLLRIEAAMSVSLSFCSSTSYRLLAESASFLSASSSVALRLW